MQNEILPLIARKSTQKPATTSDPLGHLVVYRNPKFGRTATPEAKDDINETWLPVLSDPNLLSSSLNNELKSALYGSYANTRKHLRNFRRLTRAVKRHTTSPLPQMRYSLFALALGGAIWLLAGFVVHEISAKEQHKQPHSTQ